MDKPRAFLAFGYLLFGLVISTFFFDFLDAKGHDFGMLKSIGYYAKPLSLYITMLVGMIFNQFYEEASREDSKGVKRISIKNLFADVFYAPRILMAFSVSPIVFYSTYVYVDKIPDDIIAYLFAFQNGFFWHSIITRLKKKRGRTNSST